MVPGCAEDEGVAPQRLGDIAKNIMVSVVIVIDTRAAEVCKRVPCCEREGRYDAEHVCVWQGGRDVLGRGGCECTDGGGQNRVGGIRVAGVEQQGWREDVSAVSHMLRARIRRNGGGDARNRGSGEGARAGERGERVVKVAVEDVQLLSKGLVDANEDLVVVEDVRHGGKQRVRIKVCRDVGRARRRGNEAEDVFEVGLCCWRDVRNLGTVCGAGPSSRVISRADGHRARCPCSAGRLIVGVGEVARLLGGSRDKSVSGDILHYAPRLVGEEEKGLVLPVVDVRNPDRSADGFAEVVVAKDGAWREWRYQLVAPCVGVEDIIAEELVCTSVEHIRSGFRDDVYLARSATPELGRVLATQRLDFGDGIHAGIGEKRQVGSAIHVVGAVDRPVVRGATAAVD